MENKFSIIGLVVAIIAITVAVFHDDIQKLISKEDNSTTMERVLSRGAETLGLVEAKEKSHFNIVRIAYTGLGVLSIVLAIVAYIREENHRFSGVVGAAGIVAIAWEYVLIGLIIGVIIFVLANLDNLW